jgi:toxin ParE1/3/4
MARMVIKPLADQDLSEQAAYIERDNPGATARFQAAIQKLLANLVLMPRLGVLYHLHSTRLHGIRMHPVPGFRNHLVFYRPTEEGIEVVRVLHGARDIRRIFEREGLRDSELEGIDYTRHSFAVMITCRPGRTAVRRGLMFRPERYLP